MCVTLLVSLVAQTLQKMGKVLFFWHARSDSDGSLALAVVGPNAKMAFLRRTVVVR